MATERSLERLGVDAFDVLLLHNPDRTGYTSEAVWDAHGARCATRASTDALGVAPGPANGFTLDVIDCFERFGELHRLGDGDPQPARAVARRAVPRRRARHDVEVITRVVDYGGLFWDDVAPRPRRSRRATTACSGPQGWVEARRARSSTALRPIAERHGLTPLQLAAQWNLAHEPVACVVPTLIQEPGGRADRGQARRAARDAGRRSLLERRRGRAIRAIGDNTGSHGCSRAPRPTTRASRDRTAGR